MSGFKNEYTLFVDIKNRLASPVPVFKRGDTAKLKFKIFDDGVLYDLTGFTRAEVSHLLPSGTTLVGNALLDSATGLITYDYVSAEMAEVGYVSTSLTIYSGTEQVSIQPFNVYMYDNMSDKDLSYIGILQDLIKETQILKADVTEFLDNAQATMDEIVLIKTDLETLNQSVTNAENTRITNETNRQSAESTRESNELIRIADESIRVTSENARKNAEDTRIANEDTRQTNESTRQTNESNRQTTFTNTINSVNDKLAEINEFVFVGDYNPSLVYERFNVVKYNRSSFVALKQVTGITPVDDGVNWKMVAQGGLDGDGGTVNSVNGIFPDLDGNVTIPTTDIDVIDNIISTSTVNALSANQGRILNEKFNNYIPITEKGVANGVAKLNADGKVVDALGNEVEGKITSVNTKTGDVTLTASDVGAYTTTETDTKISNEISILSQDVVNNYATKTELGTLNTDLSNHNSQKASATQLGHIKVDGITINVDGDGIISTAVNLNHINTKNTTTTIFVDGVNGTDANGFGNSSGSNAYKTIQYAINQLAKINFSDVDIFVAMGTYNEAISLSGFKIGTVKLYTGGISSVSLNSINVSDSDSIILEDINPSESVSINRVKSIKINRLNRNIASSSIGIYVANSNVIISSSAISNATNYAIRANSQSVVELINVSGTGNQTGLMADSSVIRKNGSTITGSTPTLTNNNGYIGA